MPATTDNVEIREFKSHQDWRPRHNPWAIALTVTMATFMEVLDTSIANVALPHIAGSLSATTDESTWVLTSYLVSNAVILPMSGWASDFLGRKRFYMTCVALFGASSLLCGLAPSLPLLILFRVLQGVGGGGLAPSEQAILADTFEPRKRGAAFALYGMAVVLAPAIGPTLGGWITDNYDWRWIFFINVPVALLSLFLTNRLVEDPPEMAERRKAGIKIDYIGLALVGVGLGCLQVVLDKGEHEDWLQSNFILTFAIVAVSAVVVAIFWEYYQKDPIVDVRMFKNRNFTISFVMMVMLGLALFGTTVLIPQYLQTLLGYTAEQAGMALSPGGVAVMLLMPLVGFLVTHYDARWLIAIGFLACCIALFHMTELNLGISFAEAVRLRIYQAAGIAFLFVPINTLSYVGVPRNKNNQVSGMVNLARNMGGSVGISIVETLLAQRSQKHQSDLVSHLTNTNQAFQSRIEGITHAITGAGYSAADASQRAYHMIYGRVQQQAAALAYNDVIFIFAIVCGMMVPLAFLMRKNKPGAGPGGIH
ncbi:MAG TPA: DHA2 family efflux MFS transporter permease subunit [Terriglobales bacterium]|nr:DHA2 family efflux MFS transporter permease subunit [Terriglobales bacterium]